MFNKKQLDQLVSSVAKLGTVRLATLAAVGIVIVATVVVAARYLAQPAMQPIYTGLTPQDVSRVTAELAESGIAFDVSEQRNAVLVPFGQAARARTILAKKGLPTSARAGYELFDNMGSLGLTSFMQEVTKSRALEGEIARTIQALDGVAAARVHLVLPQSGSMLRERHDPSASVLLRLDSRWQSSAGQAVRHIVAAAVPGMKVEQVSVASTDGRMIATGGDDTGGGSQKLAEMEHSMATELEQRAGRTLGSTLGSGNFQVSVTVRLDIDHEQINETTFDPRSRVERSLRTTRQSGATEDSGPKPVSVELNIPRDEGSQPEVDKRRQREDRKEELVNYELNSKTVQTVREGYRIRQLAIAAVVNKKQIAAQIGANATDEAVKARLAELKRLVAAATGANLERNDTIELTVADFNSADAPLPLVPAPGALDYLLLNLGTLVNALAMIIVVGLVITFGVRPMINIVAKRDRLTSAAEQSLPIPDQPGGQLSEPERAAVPPRLALQQPVGGELERPGLEKSPDEIVRERLTSLVAKDEVKVAKVLKGWIAETRQT